jgi:hypothetical protein
VLVKADIINLQRFLNSLGGRRKDRAVFGAETSHGIYLHGDTDKALKLFSYEALCKKIQVLSLY